MHCYFIIITVLFILLIILPIGEETPKVPGNPCEPTPCGPNSICEIKKGHPVCSCSPNYIGSPPYCRPECIMNHECPHNKACIQEKCQNPCTKSCGLNAKCDVVNHTPFCTCISGYEGDAFISCTRIPPSKCKLYYYTYDLILLNLFKTQR